MTPDSAAVPRALCFAAIMLCGRALGQSDPDAIMGFSPPDARREHELETRFQALPSADMAREWHRMFTSQPHPAASAENNRLARVLAREWARQGWHGVYHSAYDDHLWMTTIGDPTFAYHTALTRIWGLVALRLANADILPFDFAANGTALQGFLAGLQRGVKIDPVRLPLAPLEDRIAEFEQAGERLRELTLRDLASASPSAGQIQDLNSRLMQVESNWLDPAGIPGRPWFQHLLYAARYTYAHLEFPALTEAVERADWDGAARQAAVLDAALEKNIHLLDDAAGSWKAPR